MEAAADEVVHPARRHPVERSERRLELAAAQAGTRSPTRAGTSARGRSRPSCGSNCAAEDAGRVVRQLRRERLRRRLASPRPGAVRRRARLPADRRPRAGRGTPPPTAPSTCRNAGIPCRGSGGKYVPPKNGSPSGVRKTVIGQPPCPISAIDRVHVDGVDVGPLLAVDLHADEVVVHQRAPSPRPRTTRAPSRGTSGTRSSRWRASIGLSSARARANASSPHGIPVDRVVRVLEQVRARLVCESVHLLTATLPARATIEP